LPLEINVKFQETQNWGVYLSPSRFGVCFFSWKVEARKKKRPTKKKLKGVVSPGILFSKQMKLIDHGILPTWHVFGVCSWCFLSIHHGFLILFADVFWDPTIPQLLQTVDCVASFALEK